MVERHPHEYPSAPKTNRPRPTIRLASSRSATMGPQTTSRAQRPRYRPAPRAQTPHHRPASRPAAANGREHPSRPRYSKSAGRATPRRGFPRCALKRRHGRVARIAILTFALLCIGCIFRTVPAGLPINVETPQLDMKLLSPGDLPISTPASQWKRGTLPHLYQTDPAWAQQPYGGGTVYANACGPTALTMVYVFCTGNKDMTPATMAAWADAHNYAPTGATEWAFMTEGAAAFGLSSSMINARRTVVENALQAGKPVIALMDPGDFTNVGHFIVLAGIDDAGMVTVNDPSSATRSARLWPIETICAQSEYSWVFDATA